MVSVGLFMPTDVTELIRVDVSKNNNLHGMQTNTGKTLSFVFLGEATILLVSADFLCSCYNMPQLLGVGVVLHNNWPSQLLSPDQHFPPPNKQKKNQSDSLVISNKLNYHWQSLGSLNVST